MHTASIEPPFDEDVHAFYRDVLAILSAERIPFLLGGGYAMRHWTGIARDSKDLDLFVRGDDRLQILEIMDRQGYLTATPFPHWLSKIYHGDMYVDVIFNSGNGLTRVDDAWFEHAADSRFLGMPVKICPAEETLWSKAFVIERERCDAADVAHLIRAQGDHMDWNRVIHRFGENGRVLMAHVVLFGFIYPGEREKIPRWVVERLYQQLRTEDDRHDEDVCRGTLLSRAQYLVDVERWGYKDARTELGVMRASQVEIWTAAIADARRNG
jgi:hypothetical protein